MSIIELEHVSLTYESKPILNDVNFTLGNGEFVYLIGPTGTGKSSFLKMIYKDVEPDAGRIRVSDFDLNTMRDSKIPYLRRSLGIVFQDFQLLTDRTVLKNLLFVMGASGWKDKSLMERRAKEVLQLVGIESKINSMPFALSGGEQQRVSIARALLNKPKLILADEPTGNLDPETSEEIMRLLIAVAHEEKTAVLMATHDMTLVEKFPGRVLRVADGTVKEVSSMNNFDPFTAS
jgi:cell division transport system ATP-binding protein